MKYGVIAGSHRHGSQSGRVARYISRVLERDKGHEAYTLDLAGNPLPLWDQDMWDAPEKHEPHWGPVARELGSCDAAVMVVPEWNGMAPPGLKNLFLFCGNDVLAHKPVLLVGISASRGGAYPIAELRASSYKNTRVCFIPEHVIVRYVGSMLVAPEPTTEDDSYVRSRIDYALGVLEAYAAALRTVRESGVIDHARFPNGM